ncbi:transposase [Sinimarinibacterium sp. CAU 1509]|nr:transposase [Sinimarinibacterium sp. CAU 1509]
MPDGSCLVPCPDAAPPKGGVVQRACRQRCYPKRSQRQLLARHFGAARFVWNRCLRARSDAYHDPELTEMFGRGLSIGSIELSRWLTEVKRDPEFSWLSEIDSGVITQVLRDQDAAFRNFFAGRAKYPKRRKRGGSAAVRFVFDHRHAGKVKAWDAGTLVLPLLGPIKVVWSRRPSVMPKLVTVSIDSAGRFHVSMAVSETLPTAAPASAGAVGVDVGVKDLAILSNGEKIENPAHLRRKTRYLKRLQRGLSRKTKGSGRYRAHRRRVGRLQAKIADCRRDAQHQASRRIVDAAQIICIETLNVKGMVKNHRLARAISDAGVSELHRQIIYKADWSGRSVSRISQWFPSSKTCSACGAVNDALQLKDRSWTCSSCSTTHDRDVNAANNILAEGLRCFAEIGVGPGGAELMRVEGDTHRRTAAKAVVPTASAETRTVSAPDSPCEPAPNQGVANTWISEAGD